MYQRGEAMRKYEFSWELLGDISEGRRNLGSEVGVETYRLMQFTLRDVIEQRYGSESADEIFREAGRKAGLAFYKNCIEPVSSADEFIRKAADALKNKKIGVLRIEEALLDEGFITLTVDEDLDCSGLPELDYETCIYDEGFVAALLEGFTKEKWDAKEIDCWCTGARTCRFTVSKTA
jgi:predicted hydrocarbon binding protein